MANKQIYLVGGGVRDALMGRSTSDHDWLVVGQTPEQMVADGFLPVGRDFPIFLHPDTKDEYALARTERKSGPGYRGFETCFSPDVTLEQDLARRDLTINALAVPLSAVRHDAEGRVVFAPEAVIDRYGGLADLKARRLRHVGPAFVEDPVRILRLARFAARFHDFDVATATKTLMQEMVAAGEVDALVPERVWQELATGLMEAHPSRMFEVLKDCGALQRLLPEVNALWGVPQRAEYHPEIDCGLHVMMVLDQAARLGASLPVRFACLTHDLGKAATPADVLPRHLGHEGRSVKLLRALSERIRVPTECRELALIVAAEHGNIHRSLELNAASLVRLFERLDAFRRPDRLPAILQACEADARGRLGFENQPYAAAPHLLEAFEALLCVDTAQVAALAAAQGKKGPAVGRAIAVAREAALKKMVNRTTS